MLSFADVLLIGGSTLLRTEVAVYGVHADASVQHVADAAAAAEHWAGTRLILVDAAAAPDVAASPLAATATHGEIVMLTTEIGEAAWQLATAIGADYVVHPSNGVQWLMSRMREAAITARRARAAALN